MSDEERAVSLARKYALQNAVQHGGKANPGAVVGKIMAEAAELRSKSQIVMPLIQKTVAEVNAMAPEAQKEALAGIDASLLEKKTRERGHPFKALPNFDQYDTIVMRFAPNPNGPGTLGHSRGMITMSEYKRLAKAAGKDAVLILRFDDTDPGVKPPYPPAYKWIEEDYGWLGEKPDRIISASERNEEYYAAAEKLIQVKGAYICFCTQEAAKAFRDQGKPCPHRDLAVEDHLAAWTKMLAGGYEEGAATLRVKTEVAHKDPALRDWVGFRIAKTPHPMAGTKYCVWPMLDFESAVEDKLQGVTHIIRGKDLMDSTRRQQFLYKHMGWTYPETLYWGRVRLFTPDDEEIKFSTSGMRRDVDSGKVSGWDDPRLPTLRAFRRRGFKPEAIRNFWVNMGLSEKDVAASVLNLYAESAKLLEPEVDRYFFVADPVRLTLSVPTEAGDALVAETLRHPDHPERGHRVNRVPVVKNKAALFVARDDLPSLQVGALIRLKDLGNIRIDDAGDDITATWLGDDLAAARKAKAPVIHWVPDAPGETLPLEMLLPDASDDPKGKRQHGLVESDAIVSKPGRVVQFERYGYAKLEVVDKKGLVAVFAHP